MEANRIKTEKPQNMQNKDFNWKALALGQKFSTLDFLNL